MINKLKQRLPYIHYDNLLEFFEERAAIREYEGKMSRESAEDAAFFDTIDYFAVTNHILSTTDI
jgi:hypothetical protein